MRLRIMFSLLSLAAVVIFAPAAQAAELELDRSFSSNGKLIVHRDAFALGIAQTGGRIYLVGRDFDVHPAATFVTRLRTDGSVDGSFASGGTKRLPSRGPGTGFSDIVVDDSGRAVVVVESDDWLSVFRLTPTGSLDDSFAGDGVRYIDMGTKHTSLAPHVTLDNNGRIVVAAMVSSSGSGGSDVVLFRLKSDGSSDPKFSSDGSLRVDRAKVDWLDTLAVDGQDRVILGTESGIWNGTLTRFTPDGHLDKQFSGDGLKPITLTRNGLSFLLDTEVDASGSITIAVSAGGNSYGSARVKSDGGYDEAYGDGGTIGLTCNCAASAGSVSDGRVAIVAERESGDTLVTRIGSDGASLSQASGDLFSGTTHEQVLGAAFAGDGVLMVGQVLHDAFAVKVH